MAQTTESPVTVQVREEEAQGQAQVAPAKPHDGKHKVFEAVAITDKVITDANSPLAVQVPEGVGASTYGHRSPLGEALSAGTPEEQFAQADEDEDEPDVATEQNEDKPDTKAKASAKS